MNKILRIFGSFGLLLIGFLVTKYAMRMVYVQAEAGNLWYAWVAVVILAFTWVPVHVAHMKLWNRRLFGPDSPHMYVIAILIVGMAMWPYLLRFCPEVYAYLEPRPEIKLGMLFSFILGMTGMALAPRWLIREEG